MRRCTCGRRLSEQARADPLRTAENPDRTLSEFLTSTYEAAASNGGWDRAALETEPGVPRIARAVS